MSRGKEGEGEGETLTFLLMIVHIVKQRRWSQDIDVLATPGDATRRDETIGQGCRARVCWCREAQREAQNLQLRDSVDTLLNFSPRDGEVR
jgi:hypothetical protein